MSNDLKAVITLVVVAFLILFTVMWARSESAQVQAAYVTGIFSLLAAIGAAFVVFWQLRKQAENTIKANRDNEAMKLKKEIYQSAITTYDEANEANQALRRYVLEVRAEVSLVSEVVKKGGTIAAPGFKGEEIASRYEKVSAAAAKMASLTEKWAIVDERIVIFHKAFGLSAEFRNACYLKVMISSASYLTPINEEWINDQGMRDQFQKNLIALSNEINHEISFGGDFKVAMQNALLSDLFDGRKLSYRVPASPTDLVIDLDNVVEVSKKLDALRSATGKFSPTGISML